MSITRTDPGETGECGLYIFQDGGVILFVPSTPIGTSYNYFTISSSSDIEIYWEQDAFSLQTITLSFSSP